MQKLDNRITTLVGGCAVTELDMSQSETLRLLRGEMSLLVTFLRTDLGVLGVGDTVVLKSPIGSFSAKVYEKLRIGEFTTYLFTDITKEAT